MSIKHLIGTAIVALLAAGLTPAIAAEYMERNDFQAKFAFSPAVVTDGGRIVWLSGATATRDVAGNDISGQLEPQVRAIFNQMNATLTKAGGSLANLVTMTVFAADESVVPRFVAIRREMFPNGDYPSSTFIAGSRFALPGIVIEIQGIAVIGDQCSKAKPCSPR